MSLAVLQRMIAKSFALNVLVVAVPSIVLLAFGRPVIRMWAGPAISEQSLAILPGVVLGTALWALGVTGMYAMQALGRFRTVALLNISGRLCALFLLVYLLRRRGIEGVVLARVFYGATALLVYIPLLRGLWLSRTAQTSPGFRGGRTAGGPVMKILVTAISFSSKISGIQRHAFNLVRCLLAHPEISAVHLVIAPWQQEMTKSAGLAPDSRLEIHVAHLKPGSISRNLWHYRDLPELAQAPATRSDSPHLPRPNRCILTGMPSRSHAP